MKNFKLGNIDPFKKKLTGGVGARPPRQQVGGGLGATGVQPRVLSQTGMNIMQTPGYQQ